MAKEIDALFRPTGLEILTVVTVLSWLDSLFLPTSPSAVIAPPFPALDPRSVAFLEAQSRAQGGSNGDGKGKGKELPVVPTASTPLLARDKGKGKAKEEGHGLGSSEAEPVSAGGSRRNGRETVHLCFGLRWRLGTAGTGSHS